MNSMNWTNSSWFCSFVGRVDTNIYIYGWRSDQIRFVAIMSMAMMPSCCCSSSSSGSREREGCMHATRKQANKNECYSFDGFGPAKNGAGNDATSSSLLVVLLLYVVPVLYCA
jgi:hypothetical protein